MADITSGRMDVAEVARPDITLAVRRGATRLLRQSGYAVVAEMAFANGRRADLVAIRPNHEIWIIEVKSGLADFRVDVKWHEYADYCDGLAFAVAPEFPPDLIPAHVGLIVADAYGGELLRPPPSIRLSPARRKAVTLAFAQLAASRLMRLDDPDFERGI
ncbi:MAG: MmcB family DNA repair protein [Bosea sp. (in: a-proteobacteria)]